MGARGSTRQNDDKGRPSSCTRGADLEVADQMRGHREVCDQNPLSPRVSEVPSRERDARSVALCWQRRRTEVSETS